MELNVKEQVTIGGLRANAAAALINLSFFTGLGILIPIIALILETKNQFVRTYAKQTLALGMLLFVSVFLNVFIFIGNAAFVIITFVLSIVQIIAIIKSFLGQEFEIPYIKKVSELLFVD